LFGVLAALVPVLVASLIIYFQHDRAEEDVNAELDKLISDNTAHIARDVYAMCEASNELIQQEVDYSLNVARDVLKRSGGVSLADETVSWEAVNQFTLASTPVTLPKMMIGDSWLGQNKDLSVPTLVVDETKNLVGGTCTIFQRMNAAGDMLRVATNVEKKDGTRGIGTYIPAVNPDGTPNPVVATVLKGETYHGRAYVVNAWYITAYEPMKDAGGNIIGMLYVGVKQEAVTALRDSIMGITVGKTGYVYVIGGTGDQRGHYVISKNGERDGEDIWEAQDADGRYFIQSIVNKALQLKEGEVAFERYPWKNEGEAQPRMKVAAITYFAPWDWVIGAGAYEDDFRDAKVAVDNTMNTLLWWVVIGGAVVLGLVIAAAFVISHQMANPLKKLVPVAGAVARGDVHQQAPVRSGDEIGAVARAFNDVIGYMKEMATAADRISAGDLTTKIEPKSDQDTLGKAFARMIENLSSLIGKVNANAGSLSEASTQLASAANQAGQASQQVAATSQDIAKGANQQATMLQKSASMMNELGKVVDQVARGAATQSTEVANAVEAVQRVAAAADQVSQSAVAVAENAQSAAGEAEAGAEKTRKTVEGMTAIQAAFNDTADKIMELGRRSEEIGKIVAVIDDIAAQTNLLALNAAIEAARAGEHGLGFAVVSDEVRKLAERTASATKEIADLVTGVQKGVAEAVKAMQEGNNQVKTGYAFANEAGEAIERIQKAVKEVSEQIGQISTAAEEMSASAADVAKMMDAVGNVVEQNTAAAQQMSAHGQEVGASVENAASIAQQSGAATEQLSAAAEQMGAQVQQIVASSQSLNEMARILKESVAQFKVHTNGNGAKEKVAVQ